MSMSSMTPSNGSNLNNQALQAVLQKVRILCDGIPDDDQATSLSGASLKTLKRSLLQLSASPSITPEEKAKAKSVIDFMILPSMEDCLELWFGKSKETDERIWSEFAEDVAKASMGMYEHWSYAVEEPTMIVALVMYLDQFRRNMFRGTKGMYSCDKMCADYVKRAMNEGIHKSLEPVHMMFLLLVLTHSEEVEDQRLCYKEYLILEEKLGAEDPLRCFNGIFKKHLDVVEKYGRFPHRNTIHERQNTPEEDEFLLDGAFRFDLPVRKNAEGNITFARDGKQLWKVLKTKGLTHQQSFQEVAIEAQRRSSYLSLYGGHEEETSEDTKKFYYEEHVNDEPTSLLRIGDAAPDFSALSTKGHIKFHDDYFGQDESNSWCVLLFNPKAFSPVCTTELGQAAKLQSKFAEKNVKLVAVAVESLESNNQWMNEIETVCGAPVDFPIICDENARILKDYGMLDRSNKRESEMAKDLASARSAFIINPQKEVALILSYPVQVGRNFDEILRAIEALQRNAMYDVVTPAGWLPFDDIIVPPSYSSEKAIAEFGYVEEKTDYVRFTRDPMASQ